MKSRGKMVDSHHHMVGGYGEGLHFYETYQKQLELEKLQAILLKTLYPGKFYSYAGFDYYMPEGKKQTD